MKTIIILLSISCLLLGAQLTCAQRDNDDDFDDAGFDDSGYNNPQNHDAEGSNQNPSNYSPASEEDLDDDDDVDETNMRPQVAQENEESSANQGRNHNDQQVMYNKEPLYHQATNGDSYQPQQQMYAYQQQQPSLMGPGYYANVAPQRFYAPPNSVLLANVDPSNNQGPYSNQGRYKRSLVVKDEDDIEDGKSLIRNKRHSKYIGPVYTYVKTDKHAHYKWGVKHKVGKKHHG